MVVVLGGLWVVVGDCGDSGGDDNGSDNVHNGDGDVME